jgi:transcriptional regulator with XRE-family HTH domain
MNEHDLPNRPSGLDLKFARLSLGIQAREIAESLGVLPQRVSAIEASFHPSPPMVARYLAALDVLASTERPGRAGGSGGAAAPGRPLGESA